MKMKLTEKNYGSIMDKVNRFLSKSTMRDDGFKKIVVGYEKVDIGFGKTFDIPICEERHCLTPFIGGKCYVHPMYLEEQERRYKPTNYKNPIIAISSVMDDSCIPLQEGCIIEINSTKMRIVSIDTNIKTLAPITYIFLNKEYCEEEREKTIKERLRNHYSNYIYENSYYTDLGTEKLREVSRDFVNLFCIAFANALEELPNGKKEFSFEIENGLLEEEIVYSMNKKMNKPIFVNVKFENFEKNGEIKELYSLEDKEYEDLLSFFDYIYTEYYKVGVKEERNYFDEYDDFGYC